MLLLLIEVWREFIWGAIAGGFGEGIMHPVDTIKTRIQSQAILLGPTQVFNGLYYDFHTKVWVVCDFKFSVS